jgi:hypothetical protein
MSEYINITPTEATSDDKSTDIRAAMSVSNLLTPPSHGIDLPGPSTPVATVPFVPADTPVATETVDIEDAPSTPVAPMPVNIKDATSTPITPEAADIKEAPSTPASVASRPGNEMVVYSPSDAGGASAAHVDREFECKNDDYAECKTGQYTKDLSRKVISDHFGRNKACTKVIKDWPLFCRKHYQRATYNQSQWQERKVQLILRQFRTIEEQFPGTMYTVALKKSEEDRLNLFSRKVAGGMHSDDAAEFVEPRKNKHFEAPINTLRELSMDLGEDKTLEDVEQTIYNIQEMLQQGETKQVPSIEFLPQLDDVGNPWTEANGGSPRNAKNVRVNKKGGVQKPVAPKKTKVKA